MRQVTEIPDALPDSRDFGDTNVDGAVREMQFDVVRKC